jgi:hypothetical protein
MSAAEFIEWQAYLSVEPLGGRRSDLHTAMILYQQIQIHKSKNATVPAMADLIPEWWTAPELPPSPITLAEKFRMATDGL